MKRSAEAIVGAVVILGIVLVVFGTVWLKGIKPGAEDIDVKARFEEVGQLLVGSNVKLRGVPIGRVEEIALEPSGTAVVITMSIRSEVRLPEDAAVILSPESMFGDWQAEIVSRGVGDFRHYDYKESAETGVLPGYALPDMSRLTAVAAEIADNLRTISSSVEIAFTDSTAENIKRAIENITNVSDQIAGLVGEQQVALEEVAANLERTSVAAGQAAETMNRAFGEIEAAISGGRLTSIMQNVQSATSRTDSLAVELVSASRDLRRVALSADTTFRALGGIATRVQRGDGSLGLLLRDSTLYWNLSESSLQLQALLKDMRENPRKYINLTIF